MISGWMAATNALAQAMNQAGAEGLAAEKATQELLAQQQELGLRARQIGLEGLMTPHRIQSLATQTAALQAQLPAQQAASDFQAQLYRRLDPARFAEAAMAGAGAERAQSEWSTEFLRNLPAARAAVAADWENYLKSLSSQLQAGILNRLSPADLAQALREQALTDAAQAKWQRGFLGAYPADIAAQNLARTETAKAWEAYGQQYISQVLADYYSRIQLPPAPPPTAPTEQHQEYARRVAMLLQPALAMEALQRQLGRRSEEASIRGRISDDVRQAVGQAAGQLVNLGIRTPAVSLITTALTPIYTLDQYLNYHDVIQWTPEELRRLYEDAQHAHARLEDELARGNYTADELLKLGMYSQDARRRLQSARERLSRLGVVSPARQGGGGSYQDLKRQIDERYGPSGR